MQKPTIGRIVNYRCPEGETFNDSDIHPAVITRVWSDRCVNLLVFTDGGKAVFRSSVEIEDERNRAGCWSWPERN